jgi:SAM-dependent methyltransferase
MIPQMSNIPMPPMEYQVLVCGSAENAQFFETVGLRLVDSLNREGMIKPGSDFLDVGCGCGRLARYLVDQPIGSYTGFDRHDGMIDWCKREIADPRFTFDFFDIKSVYTAWDKQEGEINAANFVFPYASESFDACMLASVFTHMLPIEVLHYLLEISRVMRPGCKVLASIFFSESGVAESHDDGLNVFHDPEEFAEDLEHSGFDARLVGDMQFGYAHNWHVLTKK